MQAQVLLKKPNWLQNLAPYSVPFLATIYSIKANYTQLKNSNPTTSGSPSFGIMLTMIIPVGIIWFIATYGAVTLKHYVSRIDQGKDNQGLHLMAYSLLALTCYVILMPLGPSIVLALKHTHFLIWGVFLSNHLPVLLGLFAVSLFFIGSQKLQTLNIKAFIRQPWAALSIILLMTFFALFTLRFYVEVPKLRPLDGIPRFSVPAIVLLFSYVLPHIIMWTIGLIGCYNLRHYAKHSQGYIYKTLFHDLYKGLLIIYLSIFITQLFIINTFNYSKFNIGLVMIYGLLVLVAIGFIFVARGANKLAKIENAGQ